MIGDFDPEIPHATFMGLQLKIPAPVQTLDSLPKAWDAYGEIKRAWLCQVHAQEVNHELIADLMQHWREALDEFICNRAFKDAERRSWAFLEADYRLFTVCRMLAIPNGGTQSLWCDEMLPAMRELVDYAELAVGGKEGPECSSPFFAFDMGINVSLYTVAVMCRDPVVRRKAISILDSGNRQEGLWNGRMAARLANHILSQEESGLYVRCAQDVPDNSRVRDIRVDFLGNRAAATLSFANAPDDIHVVTLW
jgi:hypothetical protein